MTEQELKDKIAAMAADKPSFWLAQLQLKYVQEAREQLQAAYKKLYEREAALARALEALESK